MYVKARISFKCLKRNVKKEKIRYDRIERVQCDGRAWRLFKIGWSEMALLKKSCSSWDLNGTKEQAKIRGKIFPGWFLWTIKLAGTKFLTYIDMPSRLSTRQWLSRQLIAEFRIYKSVNIWCSHSARAKGLERYRWGHDSNELEFLSYKRSPQGFWAKFAHFETWEFSTWQEGPGYKIGCKYVHNRGQNTEKEKTARWIMWRLFKAALVSMYFWENMRTRLLYEN